MMNKTSMRHYMIILSLILVAVFSAPTSVFSENEDMAHVFVSPASSDALTCETHTIAIAIEDVENLTGFELKIDFDPAVVEVLNVENGDFLPDPEDDAFYSPANNDGEWNEDGFIIFGLVLQGEGTGDPDPQSEAGDLILITMQGLVHNQTTTFEIDEEESKLVWWGEDGQPPEPGDPVDGSLIPYTKADGTVRSMNCPPVAHPQTVTTEMNTPVAITLTGSDPDGDPLSFSITQGPSHGTLSGTPPNVVYTPNHNYYGEDSFQFVVNDGYTDSAPATVTINVTYVPPENVYYFPLFFGP